MNKEIINRRMEELNKEYEELVSKLQYVNSLKSQLQTRIVQIEGILQEFKEFIRKEEEYDKGSDIEKRSDIN